MAPGVYFGDCLLGAWWVRQPRVVMSLLDRLRVSVMMLLTLQQWHLVRWFIGRKPASSSMWVRQCRQSRPPLLLRTVQQGARLSLGAQVPEHLCTTAAPLGMIRFATPPNLATCAKLLSAAQPMALMGRNRLMLSALNRTLSAWHGSVLRLRLNSLLSGLAQMTLLLQGPL